MTLDHRGALPVHEELNLAFEHVERVRVIVVDVGIDIPARFKNSVDDLEVGEFSEQPVRSVVRLKPLAFVRGCEERFHHADHAEVVMHAQSPAYRTRRDSGSFASGAGCTVRRLCRESTRE